MPINYKSLAYYLIFLILLIVFFRKDKELKKIIIGKWSVDFYVQDNIKIEYDDHEYEFTKYDSENNESLWIINNNLAFKYFTKHNRIYCINNHPFNDTACYDVNIINDSCIELNINYVLSNELSETNEEEHITSFLYLTRKKDE